RAAASGDLSRGGAVSATNAQVAAAAEIRGVARATVAALAATPFRLRYASEISLSDGVRQSAEQLLVTVTTSDGVSGHAECIPRPGIYGETIESARRMIER